MLAYGDARVSQRGHTGIDIGTTAVKAVAADEDGRVVARTRIPHQLRVPEPDHFEHDAEVAWRRGPVAAWRQLATPDVAAVAVSAMVPSMTAVDAAGGPITPGLLYGDSRGRTRSGDGLLSDETAEFLRWTARAAPDAAGYWPAPAVANYALGDRRWSTRRRPASPFRCSTAPGGAPMPAQSEECR